MADISGKIEETAENGNGRKSYTFEEFCNETKKIEIVWPGVTKYDESYMFNPAKGVKHVSLFGLYFPNDEEIRKICREFNILVMEQKDLGHQRNMDDYFSGFFMSNFMSKLNVKHFEKDPFEETKEFLKSKSAKGLYLKKDVDELIQIIGRVYTGKVFHSAELLDADIRIRALNMCPKFNIIGNLEKGQIGYYGKAYEISSPSDKK